MPLVTSPGRQLQPDGEPSKPEDHQKQRLILALILFLSAIGVVIYKSATSAGVPQPLVASAPPIPVSAAQPSAQSATVPGADAPSEPAGSEPAKSEPVKSGLVKPAPAKSEKPSGEKPQHLAKSLPTAPPEVAPAPTVVRKVLPPLAVEVFAGGRPVPLQTNPAVAVHVDTSGGVQGRAATPSDPTAQAQTHATPGRVKISPEALQVLSHPVDPNYPLLAREMKVQGSVILDAFISRDGSIQALKIVSGPAILATAAMEAVRQWRFKPYLQAGQPVETEARITVNFTISTT